MTASSDAVPAPVRIDDLGSPRFTPEIAAIRDRIGSFAARRPLEPAALMAEATRRTGLDDFGDDGFDVALDVLCRSFRESAGLSDAGLVSMNSHLVRLLRNRLLIQEQLARHPEIESVEIDRPIFVIGLPRTGSTHLHNVIAEDPSLRTLPYWESLEPVLADEEVGVDPDPRFERTQRYIDFMNSACPYFVRMHELTVHHAAEDFQLLELTFVTPSFETLAPMPSYRDWLLSVDRTDSYRYVRKVLRVLQWLRGGRRWFHKSALNHEGLGPLAAAFPDATFVMTHRNPAAILASLITMYVYLMRMQLAEIDPVAIGAYWTDRIESFLRLGIVWRDELPADRFVDVHFDRFMADQFGTIRGIYDAAGVELRPGSLRRMEDYVATHSRSRYGPVLYDLADFGLDANAIRDRFAFYTDRFDAASEGAINSA